ncbi:MAG TPA: hypothetical protein VFR24_11445 [Candidatus Angelobacter sp.]|nr:hypothetical protein [Candidatus Angelobacter sp.]
MAEIRDLWPDDIGVTSIVPPVSIMREQAALLGRKTKQLLRAHVSTESQGSMIHHTFVVVAPAIDYRLELFYISHEIDLYPLRATWKNAGRDIDDEKQFIDFLTEVFGSKDTKKMISSLIAQSRDEASPAPAEIKDEDIPF